MLKESQHPSSASHTQETRHTSESRTRPYSVEREAQPHSPLTGWKRWPEKDIDDPETSSIVNQPYQGRVPFTVNGMTADQLLRPRKPTEADLSAELRALCDARVAKQPYDKARLRHLEDYFYGD